MDDEVAGLLDRQEGVIARRQAIATGLAPHDIRRLLRRDAWRQVHRGVYVSHNADPTWQQRAWAAVLGRGPPRCGVSRPSARSTVGLRKAPSRFTWRWAATAVGYGRRLAF